MTPEHVSEREVFAMALMDFIRDYSRERGAEHAGAVFEGLLLTVACSIFDAGRNPASWPAAIALVAERLEVDLSGLHHAHAQAVAHDGGRGGTPLQVPFPDFRDNRRI